MPRRRGLMAIGALLASLGATAAMTTATALGKPTAAGAQATPSSCQLAQTSGTGTKHVVYLVFDNTHLQRDNPNVPSDLEQMPHLLNFLKGNGTVLSNNHTPLIAHTAGDIVTGLTGVYPDRSGLNVSNSYGYFNPDGSVSFPSAFTYWTDPVQDSKVTNPPPNLVTSAGRNAPAPWVPFTRAGCDVGVVAAGDMALENTSTAPTGDITKVFGQGSSQYNEAVKENANGAPRGRAAANFEGVVIHCAQGSATCQNGENDLLPDEPKGYTGFKGLFGAVQVNPFLTGQPDSTDNGGYEQAPAVQDLSGNPIKDSNGNNGFPGFDSLPATTSLGYTAKMLEGGVPVTYSYISDAHDSHTSYGAYGPGEAGYVAQLKAYDNGFQRFFTELQSHGINKSNTLFVVTADEGDHFAGTKPQNNCDGVYVPCTYDRTKLGEINYNIQAALQQVWGNTTPFDIHYDSAPVFYVHGKPAQTDPAARQLERDTAALPAFNPILNRYVPLTKYLADPAELRLLHMETGDPNRNPTFVQFADPNYYIETSSSCPNASGTTGPGCPYTSSAYAWNHGDRSNDVNRTYLGIAGPGVQNEGIDGSVWADHTDIRPTMMSLLGLKDDYRQDGRVLTEIVDPSHANPALETAVALRLQHVYKQLEAPVGEFGTDTLRASTGALRAGDPGDQVYSQCEAEIGRLGSDRDTLGGRIGRLLYQAEFHGQSLDPTVARELAAQGQQLLDRGATVAGYCG